MNRFEKTSWRKQLSLVFDGNMIVAQEKERESYDAEVESFKVLSVTELGVRERQKLRNELRDVRKRRENLLC